MDAASSQAANSTSLSVLSPASGNGLASSNLPKALEMLRAVPEEIVSETSNLAHDNMPLQDNIASIRFTSGVLAPVLVKAPGNVTMAAAKQAAVLQGPNEMLGNTTGLVSMLCKPVLARVAPPSPPKVVGLPEDSLVYVAIFIPLNVYWMVIAYYILVWPL